MIRSLIIVIALALTLPSSARADGYDPEKAGHPLRVAAYLLHPVGVILDRAIFRPAWHIAQHEPIRTLVGMRIDEVPDEEREPEIPNPFLEP